ncbi:MAG: PP2C family protein-serine/threonine phosphatase [Mycobacteriaceae bacterium]
MIAVAPVASSEAVLRGELDRLRDERDSAIAALVDTQDRLAAVGALMQIPVATLEENEVIERTLAEALELTGSDATRFSAENSDIVVIAQHYSPVIVQELRFAIDKKSADQLTGTRAVVPVPGLQSGLLIAIRRGKKPYSTGDLQMLETVAAAVGKLRELAHRHYDEVQRATIEREHRLASELAQAVLPTSAPSIAGLDVYSQCVQAAVTGGDLLVFSVVGGVLWFAVGDVAGKGLPAATVMTRTVSALRVAFLTSNSTNPAGAVEAVARELNAYLDSAELFVTLAVGTVNPQEKTLRICNAGHSPLMYRGANSFSCRIIDPTCPPVGVPFGTPTTVELDFESGSVLLVGTDGLAEQDDPQGNLFGYERISGFMSEQDSGAQKIGRNLMAAVDEHAAGMPAADDRTLVVLQAVEFQQ